ncbi:MAG: DUF4286 family protein [Chitinophagia bacterium]|jgi:hypothetical protein
MQVYNISFQVNESVESAWKAWMKETFIPMIQATACFEEIKWYQLSVNSDQEPTYTMQLFTPQQDQLQAYHELHATAHLKEVQQAWGEKCFYFCTQMQIVN